MNKSQLDSSNLFRRFLLLVAGIILLCLAYGVKAQSCSDISVYSFNFHVPENSTSYKEFRIENNTNVKFYFERLEVYDNSDDFILYRDSSVPEYLNAFDRYTLKIRIDSEDVTHSTSGTGYLRIAGHFDGGMTCSVSDIGEKSFTVYVDDANVSSCSLIDIQATNIFLDENETQYDTFNVRNDASKTFYLDEAAIEESSEYYSQQVDSFDQLISGNSSANIRIKTIAYSVAGTKSATSKIKVRGHFSDGNSCGYSDLNKDFQTIVQDTDGTNEDLNTDCAELNIETHTVEVNENSSILDNFFLRNDSERNFYLDELKVFDNDEYFMSIEQDFEKRADKDSGKAALYFKIQSFEDSAGHYGNATIQVKGHFSNGKTCSYTGIGKKTFTVNINAAPVAPPYVPPVVPTKNIEITNYPTSVDFNAHTFIAVTVKNNYSSNKTVNFGFSGFPAGLMLENTSYVIPANSSKTVYLDIDSKGNTGTFNGKLFIESDGSRQEKSITLIAGATTVATEPIDVQIQSSESKGSYDVVIKIKNNLEDSIQGTLSLDVPKEWIVSGLTEISLFSGQEKTTILHVVPNTPVAKETISMVSFKANGNEIKKAISFKPTASIVGTAFAVFSDSAVGIGILIIVIIALVFVWRAVAR